MKMEDSAMYGGHAAVNNHSMGSILASSVPFDYNVANSFGPVSHGRTEDICDILQQIVSISSQSLDEAQMRFATFSHSVFIVITDRHFCMCLSLHSSYHSFGSMTCQQL